MTISGKCHKIKAEPCRVVLASIGSDGDIFPYVGLGVELRQRGHGVTLVASAHYLPLAQQHGLDFCSLHSQADNHELFSHPDFWHPIKTARVGAAWGLKRIEGQYAILREVCAHHSTLLVANPGILAAMLVNEKHGTPWANVVLQPWMIPSVSAPPMIMGLPVPRRAPACVYHLCFRFIDVAGDLLLSGKFNKLRISLNLPPIRRILRRWLSPQLVIGAFPPWYAHPQPDWPKQVKLAGFPMYEGTSTDELASDVTKFCQTGPAPVALTFGTEMMHSRQLFKEAIAGCQLLGKRALALTKYGEQLPEPLPDNVLHCSFAPFRKLFPLCSAVVHHGGIGTTAQALAAGTPQLILPIAYDQADNAERVKRLGGGDSIPSRRASGPRIARALSGLLNPGPRKPQMITDIKDWNGLAKAADYVEELAAQTARAIVR